MKFAKENVGPDFLKKLGKQAISAQYILENPPMKQVLNERGKVIWKEVPNNDKTVEALFGHIRRIRNNLFHGAKFNGTWFAPERSKKLLKSGLEVLSYFHPSRI